MTLALRGMQELDGAVAPCDLATAASNRKRGGRILLISISIAAAIGLVAVALPA